MDERGDLRDELTAYGALASQIVDVARDEPRALRYLDLRAPSNDWRPPVVVETGGRPCIHVFDGRRGMAPSAIQRWCMRVTLRGDGAWIGVLEPGILRVFRADITKEGAREIVRPAEELCTPRGTWALPKLLNDAAAGRNDVARRRYLMRLLDHSARAATNLGLSPLDALSLVGRGLFWRFLVDRGLLFGVAPGEVCEGATSWEACLDNKTHAMRTFRWLDDTFNGGLLPFDTPPKSFAPEVFSRVLGNIAHRATETGQLFLPTAWSEVNFAHIPIGLLSEVYEAFAHHVDAGAAKRTSIHYTPSHLVDFIVSQALAELPKGGKPRLLDPAAGAGVFLVTAFRKLVEREWTERGERPKRRKIREILNQQITGFDVDGRALRLAELALYLTAIELDPKPKPLNELRFDALRGKALFDLSGVEHGSLGPVEDRFRGAFDLVLGNPPWTAEARGGRQKKAWVKHSLGVVRARLGDERADGFDLPDTNKDLPFVWRALEWAKDGGRIALLTHARWLFGISPRATKARNDLLEATRVTGILNGSLLRLTSVWPNVDAPWCVLFATNERPEPFDQAALHFVSPALDEAPDARQARFRIDWRDAQVVLAQEIVDRPWTFKARFRGDRLAARAVASMRARGEQLGAYLERLGTRFWNGYQVAQTKQGSPPTAAHLRGLPDTKSAADLDFVVDVSRLLPFERDTTYRAKKAELFRAPLLLMRKAIPANIAAPRAHIAWKDVAFHESFHGASFASIARGAGIARYLQILLQSSAFPFFEILSDGQYGMFVDAIYLESALLLPVVPFEHLSPRDQGRVEELSAELASGMTEELARAIDAFVFDTFDLPNVEREAIRDIVETALPSAESKQRALAATRSEERARFLDALTSSLGNVLSASGLRVSARERTDLAWSPWRVLEVCASGDGGWSSVTPPAQAFLEQADEGGASLVVVRADDRTWFLGLLDRYALWTRTRARLLAGDLIAERS